MSQDCGCGSGSIIPPCTPPVYPGREDCVGTVCEEINLAECIKYIGPNLPTIGVTNGMSIKEALIALNLSLLTGAVYNTYTITVGPTQKKTTVTYISKTNQLTTVSVTHTQSPINICALLNTPAILSGDGALTTNNVNC